MEFSASIDIGSVLVYICLKTCVENLLVCVGNPLLVGGLVFGAVWAWLTNLPGAPVDSKHCR